MLPASLRYFVVPGMNDRPAPTAPSSRTRNPSLTAPSAVFGSQSAWIGTSSAFADAPSTEIHGRKTARIIARPPANATGFMGSCVERTPVVVAGIGCGADGEAGNASEPGGAVDATGVTGAVGSAGDPGVTSGIGAVGSAGAAAPAVTGDAWSSVSPVPSACPQLRQKRSPSRRSRPPFGQ